MLAPTRHSACHRCSFGSLSVTSTEDRESVQLPDLVAAVRHAVALPVIAAGGIATAADVTAALRAGAVAAMVGTVLLRTRRADPTGAQAAAAALAASDGRSQVGLEPHGAWTNRRGATAGASIPPSAVGSWLPLA
ncbi:nitronate monooxygenase [Streptomyces sp. NPDC002838]|uniref:nitronate monooxygenase n=1 Tax=Streptomyces sp. NPDC002838 TaxID=3154436 RepID=UPI00332FAFC1